MRRKIDTSVITIAITKKILIAEIMPHLLSKLAGPISVVQK
jgi:hypothetical protein